MKADYSQSNRIQWIDLAKGLAMFAVIAGHTIDVGYRGNIIRGIIYSVHMPLFFILSCITYHYADSLQGFIYNVKKSAKHLLIPALIIYAIRIVVVLARTGPEQALNWRFWSDKGYTLLMASGVNTSFFDLPVEALGLMWFFFALFLGRMLLDYLQLLFNDKQVSILCMMISCLGCVLGAVQWLPFSTDVAMTIMPLMYLGMKWKELSFSNSRKIILRNVIVFFAGWILTLLIQWPDVTKRTYIELAARRYPFGPFCLVTSILGTIFICELANALERVFKKLCLPFEFLGKKSLYMLCIHGVDIIWVSLWRTGVNQYVWACKRILFDLLVFLFVTAFIFVLKKINANILKEHH